MRLTDSGQLAKSVQAPEGPLSSLLTPTQDLGVRPLKTCGEIVSTRCGFLVVAVGLFVMAGWIGHWTTLSRVLPGFLPMKYNTALCFVAAGLANILLWTRSMRWSAAFGAFIFVMMGSSFLENLTGYDFGFDSLFFNSYQQLDAFPNRVSPLTGASFSLSGLALMLVGLPVFRRFSLAIFGMAACAVAMIALVAMGGYTFGVESASGWGAYARMSLYTALTFLILNFGFFIWAWTRARRHNVNFLRLLPVAASMTLMAMVALISAVSFIELQKSQTWQLHAYSVLDSSRNLQSDLIDAVRGMRGYVLTSNPSSLPIYRSGTGKLPKDMASLFQLTKDNNRQQENLRALATQIENLQAYLKKLYNVRQHSLREAISLESTGYGFALQGAVLSDLQAVNAQEESLVTLRATNANSGFHRTSRLLTYGSVLAAGLLLLSNMLASYEVGRRRRSEDALRAAIAHQTELTVKAQTAERAKSDFLSSMSHELRTPLNAILGFAQLMESAEPPPNNYQNKCLSQILQGGWYLLHLINEILDLAAIESGKLSLSKESVLLTELISTCCSMLEAQAGARMIRIEIQRPNERIYVRADHTRLKQIVLNLLSNAVKYNRIGGIVRVESQVTRPGRIRVSVTDTGAGLSADKVAQLFTPFNRLGQESGDITGTGIGLVMSKRLAELMDGTMGVESRVGQGSTFWCELPAAPTPPVAEQIVLRTDFNARTTSDDAERHTLLYVEDNPANMILVENLIARFPHFELLTAVDATRGIELARTSSPSVILMDLNLPGLSGMQALAILKKDPHTADIPIIAVSANATSRDVEKGLKAGFSDYLTKPIKISEFTDALMKTVSGQGPMRKVGKESGHGQLVGHS